MVKTCAVSINTQGRYYTQEWVFTKSKWVSIIDLELCEIEDFGKCPTSRLKQLAKIGDVTARKAIVS